MGIPISYFGHSIAGKRENNEDNFCIETLGKNHTLIAVADGMGGMAAGETASLLAIETLKKGLGDCSKSLDPDVIRDGLVSAYLQIQNEIACETLVDSSLNGMGTTLTSAVIFDEGKLIYGNIGDSRLYIIHKGKITRLTRDHSYIQEYRDKNNGIISQQILLNYSNLLTRTLDGGKDVPDIYPEKTKYLKLKKGSILLLCSDGLILNQSNEEEKIKQLILGQQSLEKAAKVLAENALRRGSKDNVTVVLFEYGKHRRLSKLNLLLIQLRNNRKPEAKKSKHSASKKLKIGLYLSAIVFLLTLGVLALNMVLSKGTSSKSEDRIAGKSIPKEKVEEQQKSPKEILKSWKLNDISEVYVLGSFFSWTPPGTHNYKSVIKINGNEQKKLGTQFEISKENGFEKGKLNTIEIQCTVGDKKDKRSITIKVN